MGRLEREKKCLYTEISKLIKKIQRKNDHVVVLVIRENLIKEILRLFEFKPQKTWILEEKPNEKKVKEIYDFILQKITK